MPHGLTEFRCQRGQTVHVSTSEIEITGPATPPAKVVRFFNELVSISATTAANKRITPNERHLVQSFLDSKDLYCIAPLIFLKSSPRHLAIRFARYMLEHTELGRSLVSELRKAGLFNFVERQRTRDQRTTYAAIVERLLASFCMSITGIADAREIPVDAFRLWLSHFRTEDGLRWRGDIFDKSALIYFQCMKEIVRAFSILAGAPELEVDSGQIRQTSNGTDTWKQFRASATGCDVEWLSFFDDWTTEVRVSRADSRAMIRGLCQWSRVHFPSASVAEVMSTQTRPETFASFALSHRGGGKSTSNVVRLAKRFSSFVEGALRSIGVQEALWPLALPHDEERAREADRRRGGSKPRESQSSPLPPYLFPIVEEILEEGEEGWPGQCSLFYEDYLDPSGRKRRLYCPVMVTFFQILLILPLRGIQLARFDSGEGDTKTFDGSKREWTANTGEAANYWKRREGAAARERGYARQVGDVAQPVTGIFVNTNKTGDPYVIPWEHPLVHKKLWELRLWQERNFPIETPMSPSQYVAKDEKAEEGRLAILPDAFFVFRLPSGRRDHVHGAPPSWRRRDQVWQELMLETERRWNERNPERKIMT